MMAAAGIPLTSMTGSQLLLVRVVEGQVCLGYHIDPWTITKAVVKLCVQGVLGGEGRGGAGKLHVEDVNLSGGGEGENVCFLRWRGLCTALSRITHGFIGA